MKVLFITRSLPCHAIGGMELVAWDVAVGLAERGFSVDIVTTALPEGNESRAYCTAPSGLSSRFTMTFLEGTEPGRYSREWWKRSREWWLKDGIRSAPDLLLTVSSGARSILPVAGDIPVVMQVHGTSLNEFGSRLRSGSFRAAVKAPYNLLSIFGDLAVYRRIDRAVAVGPGVYAALGHPLVRSVLPGNKVLLIPNGVDTGRFKFGRSSSDGIRKRYGIPEEAKVLLSVSRLHIQKGVHLALDAFSRAAGSDPSMSECWFLVVGGGTEEESLKRMCDERKISDRVVFTGSVAPSELPDYYAASDAFIFTTTHSEGLPGNVLEALSTDLPCIISKHLLESIEGINYLEGVFGVRPEDSGAVAAKIPKAFALAPRFSGNASARRRFIEQHYSRKAMLDGYQNLLNSL